MLSDKLRELRHQFDLPQLKVTVAFDIKTVTYCKIETSNHPLKRVQVGILGTNENNPSRFGSPTK